MKHVVKLVVTDSEHRYLLLTRDNHPFFGNDPDLPGGTLEEDELPVQALTREVYEEVGMVILPDQLKHLYTGTHYSKRGTTYSLYRTSLTTCPIITISWEHTAYDWLDYDNFLARIEAASDPYMHMVYNTLAKSQ